MPLAKAQAFTRVGDRASAVVAVLDDQEGADAVAAALRAPGLEVLTWRDLNEMMLTLRESAMGILYLMYVIVLAIVAVVVANTLLMSVFERTREMGILAALGMKGRQIMGMFLMESATLGVLGVLLGVGLGSLGVYYLATVGISFGDMDMSEIAGTGSSGFAMGTTLYGTFAWADTVVLAVVCLVIILWPRSTRPGLRPGKSPLMRCELFDCAGGCDKPHGRWNTTRARSCPAGRALECAWSGSKARTVVRAAGKHL